jgi:hypothetical protein
LIALHNGKLSEIGRSLYGVLISPLRWGCAFFDSNARVVKIKAGRIVGAIRTGLQ